MKKKKKTKLTGADFLSTGSTLLNLALTGKPKCGFVVGKYHLLVGDSASGKTWLSLTCLAEAATKKRFKNYRFIFDNCEDGALMDIERYFGKRVAKRLEPPATDNNGMPVYSSTIEEFYYHIDDALSTGGSCIYILDSIDSLTSKSEREKFHAQKNAHRKGNQTAGSFGDGKAKVNSGFIRDVIGKLKKTNSILIIINQTRDNLGFGFETKTRSGGRALRFYACLEIWSSIKQRIKKTVRGKKRQLGIMCKILVKKNRITGQEDNAVIIPIYHSSGIDDVGSCVSFLIEEGHWKKAGNKINAKEFDFKGTEEQIVRKIEKDNLENDLVSIVGDVWDEIQQAERDAVKRKRRYE